jgi:DnaJ-class molecular chaperone
VQLGVSVEFEEIDLKKAYRKAAMKVPDPVSSNTSI